MSEYSEGLRRSKREALAAVSKTKDSQHDIFVDEMTANWKSEIDAIIDNVSLKNLYYSEPWIYITVNLVARKISRQPLEVYREILSNGSIIKKPYDNHSLIDLFDMPNEYESYTNFMYKIASELTLMGNAIIWRLKFHKQMMLLPTELVTIENDSTGKILYYQVNFGVNDQFSNIFNGSVKIFPQDIIHIRLPHLNSMYFGLSPFIPGRKSALFDKYTKEFQLNYYLKQANPGPVLEMGETANEKQAMRLLKSMELNWTGRRNQRRTMILPKGVTAKTLQQTIAEQQLKDHLLLNRDDIRGLLAIPPHELGLQGAGSIGSNETKEQIKNFWEQTIIPFQNLIADTFSMFFRKELGPKTFIRFDNSDIQILQEDSNEKADLAIKLKNVWTLNEIRKELYDKNPVDGGDVVQSTQQQQQPFYNQFSNGYQNQSNQNQESNEELENEQNEDQKPLPMDSFLRIHKEWWLGRQRKELDDTTKNEIKVLKSVLGIFEDQAEIAVSEFVKIYRERLKQNGFYPEEERLKTALNDAFTKFETRYVKESVEILLGSSDLGYDLHLEVPFNLPSKDEIIALKARNEDKRKASLEARAIRNFQGFSQTTTNDILKTIERGIKSSKTLQDIAKDIVTYFGEYAPNRAKTIARTETLLAVSLGQKACEDDASTVIPGLKKIWVTAGDERVRSFANGDASDHVGLDGVMVEVGKDFKTPAGANLEFPRDPRGPANEIINCFVHDTKIQCPSMLNAMQSFFDGEIVEIETDDGIILKATPNHPILTRDGWIAIGELKKGDQLINGELRQNFILPYTDVNNMPTTIGEIFDSLSNSGDVMRIGRRVVNFHGDRPTGDVNIVNVDSFLKNRGITTSFQDGIDFSLKNSDFRESIFFCNGGSDKSTSWVRSPHSSVGSKDLFSPKTNIFPFPFNKLGLTSSSLAKTIGLQMSNDSYSSPIRDITNLVYTHFFNKMKSNKIVDVRFSNFSGHVYNLHTKHGWYTANGIVVKNCRCTWLMVPPDELNRLDMSGINFTGNI